MVFKTSEELFAQYGNAMVFKVNTLPNTIYTQLGKGLSINFSGSFNATDYLTIDWGDGTATDIKTSVNTYYNSYKHTYATDGEYIIMVIPSTTNVRVGQIILSGYNNNISEFISWGNLYLNRFNYDYNLNIPYIPVFLENSFYSGSNDIEISMQCGSNWSSNFANNLVEAIPADLFSKAWCSKISSLMLGFLRSTTLPNIDTLVNLKTLGLQGFIRITAIPAGYLQYNTKLTKLYFSDFRSLQSVPAGLLDSCTELVNVGSLFYYAYKLRSIPADLFKYNTKLQEFTNAFAYSGLEAIPAGLFATNIEGLNFNSTFAYSNIAAIPDNLFASCTKATNFSSCFNSCVFLSTIGINVFTGCVAVTTFQSCFYWCFALKAIPDMLFAGCVAATNFYATFQACKYLDVIPENTFLNCTAAADFSLCFGSTNISILPAGLFASCFNATTFYYTFQSCLNLTTIHQDLFKNCTKVTSFVGTFSYCKKLETIPSQLFYYSPVANDFQNSIAYTAIKTIPTQLFKTNAAATFGSAFYQCPYLESVPNDFLAECPNITSIASIFAYCKELNSVPSTFCSNKPSLNDASGVFSGCVSFQIDPTYYFQNCPSITKMGALFQSCIIVDFPISFLKNRASLQDISNIYNSSLYVKLSLASDAESLLKGCTGLQNITNFFANKIIIGTLPDNFFADCINVTNIYGLFSCFYLSDTNIANISTLLAPLVKVTTADYMFSNCFKISSIPNNIFSTMVELTSAQTTFNSCKSLLTVGNIFENNTKLKTLSSCFWYSGLKSISPTAFDKLVLLENMSSCFYSCVNNTSIPNLSNNVALKNVSSCWYGNKNLTGMAPELWNRVPTLTGYSYAFRDCINLTNYSAIPATWK